MSKMDEMILVVEREHLFENETLSFQGVLTVEPVVNHIMRSFDAYKVVRRGDAEENPKWKQPIPYVILKRGEEVFVYKRLSGGGEARLYDQLSIGVGGHMNPIEGIDTWSDTLMVNMYRELNEELEIEFGTPHELDVIGLINDDENEVGRVHIGILMVIDLPETAEVSVRETDNLEGYWLRSKDLTKSGLFERLETWSQYAAEVICESK